MGISAGGGPGQIKSDINVTPLVDIVLVLLIIFLVTMPIQMRQITVEVPRKIDEKVEVTPNTQITVKLLADGSVVVNDGTKDTSIDRIDLAKILRPIIEKKRTEKVVFADFDDDVIYGDAVSVMDTIKGAGATKVAIKLREPGAAEP